MPIIDDDIPEPVEVLEIVVECEDNGNCYLPRRSYTITIIDDQGTYVYRAYVSSSLTVYMYMYNSHSSMFYGQNLCEWPKLAEQFDL